jgi:tetratricopeptide (TPR) repeat protein
VYRIHLHQIHYSPAFYSADTDYLGEPCCDLSPTLGSLAPRSPSISTHLRDSRLLYLQHITSKLVSLVQWSGERGADLVAFPEYSVPVESLREIRSTAQQHSMVLVGGSHRVRCESDAEPLYDDLGGHAQFPCGHACSPIFLPDSSVVSGIKQRRSQWEPDLAVEHGIEGRFEIQTTAGVLRMAVLLCVDTLQPATLGKLWDDAAHAPHILICPARSGRTDTFEAVKTVAAVSGAVFLYVNSSAFGGTQVGFPDSWEPRLSGKMHVSPPLQECVEAVLEFDVEPEAILRKSGSVDAQVPGRKPRVHPIVHSAAAPDALAALAVAKEHVREEVSRGAVDAAAEWLDLLLTEHAADFPPFLAEKVTQVRRAGLRLYSGDSSDVADELLAVTIGNELETTPHLWGTHTMKAIRVLTEQLQDPEYDDPNAYPVLSSLKKRLRSLPLGTLDLGSVPSGAKELPPPVFMGDPDLLSSFQDRGPSFSQIEAFIRNDDCRVIIVTGGLGSGKSEMLNVLFRKILTDWEVLKIELPTGASAARLVAEIGARIGIRLDINALAGATHTVFRKRVRELVAALYGKPKRALVIDDLGAVLGGRNKREFALLDILVQEAADPGECAGGRIFIASSSVVPRHWLNRKGLSHHHVGRLPDNYIDRIIQHHLRHLGKLEKEAPFDIPQQILDLIQGHALSALFCAEVLAERGREVLTKAGFQLLEAELAERLLALVPLQPEDMSLLRGLSVFRVTALISELARVGFDEKAIARLSERCVLSSDTQSVSMHEAARRYFYSSITSEDERKALHTMAAAYYEPLFLRCRQTGQWSPAIAAEFCHHLSQAGRVSEARNYGIAIIDELKEMARQLYRDHREHPSDALSMYRLLAELAPDDPQIHAYIGRCYGRLGRWGDSDEAFQTAVDVEKQNKKDPWWIHRDWGHIRQRFGYFDVAETHYAAAEETRSGEVSILSNRAFIRWRQGDIRGAIDLYESAHAEHPGDEFTLTYYVRLLEETGDRPYAEALRNERDAARARREYEEPDEYPLEEEFFDL